MFWGFNPRLYGKKVAGRLVRAKSTLVMIVKGDIDSGNECPGDDRNSLSFEKSDQSDRGRRG